MAEVNKTMTMVGTPFYVAPEVVKGDHYSTSADVYSYAMTLLCFAIRGEKSLSEWLKSAYIKSKTNRKTNKGEVLRGAKRSTIAISSLPFLTLLTSIVHARRSLGQSSGSRHGEQKLAAIELGRGPGRAHFDREPDLYLLA